MRLNVLCVHSQHIEKNVHSAAVGDAGVLVVWDAL